MVNDFINGEGIDALSKKFQCAKSTIIANLYNDPLREPCEIEVAIANFQFDDDQYYKGEKLHSIQDGSLGLLPILTGIASTVGWI